MKEQTFIVKIEDAAGNVIDFERFACKKAVTCYKYIVDAVKKYSVYQAIYKKYIADTDGAARVKCYATYDGSNRVEWEKSLSILILDAAGLI